ncbi:MAG TPA: hypothetical protein VFH61_03440 [Thermoleophilia bacterium]|nr:hypothetical protein [Thermoleophilia bacterium]
MDRAYIIVLAFLFVVLVALAAAWWYARHVKQNLDKSSPVVAGTRALIDLTPASMAQLRGMSAEPILLKQSEEGLRVQIEQRPMLPMMAFAGKPAGAALSETAAGVTQLYGAKWVIMVSASEDGRVTVQRLA